MHVCSVFKLSKNKQFSYGRKQGKQQLEYGRRTFKLKLSTENNGSFHERAEIINYNFPLGEDNKKDKGRNVDIVCDSMLNDINSSGLSKSKKVSVSNHPRVTNEDILSEVEESLKTFPDTLIVQAGINDLTKSTNTLSIKNMRKSEKNLARYKDCVL